MSAAHDLAPRGARTTWVRHPDLLAEATLACVDGRADHAVVGTPGGTLGEIVAVLAAAEGLLGRALESREVDAFLCAVGRTTGTVYHHTDEHALEQLGAALEAEGLVVDGRDSLAVEALLRGPPPVARSMVEALLADPAHVGCGHLAAMLREPEAYGVRRGLVQAVLRSFFRGLWGGRLPVVFEVLTGEHQECEVVVVRSCGQARSWGRTPSMVPVSDQPSFVLHADAARWFRRQLCLLLLDGQALSDEDRAGLGTEQLVETADRVAGQQLEQTLGRLAADLPVRELQPPCDG